MERVEQSLFYLKNIVSLLYIYDINYYFAVGKEDDYL